MAGSNYKVSSKKGGGSAPRKNPGSPSLQQLAEKVLPFVSSGALGLLDARNPSWWQKLGPKLRIVVLVAVALVAQRRKMPRAAHTAWIMASYYAGLHFGAKAEPAETAEPKDVKGLDDDLVEDMDALDFDMMAEREMRTAIEHDTGALFGDDGDMGAIFGDDGDIGGYEYVPYAGEGVEAVHFDAA